MNKIISIGNNILKTPKFNIFTSLNKDLDFLWHKISS